MSKLKIVHCIDLLTPYWLPRLFCYRWLALEKKRATKVRVFIMYDCLFLKIKNFPNKSQILMCAFCYKNSKHMCSTQNKTSVSSSIQLLLTLKIWIFWLNNFRTFEKIFYTYSISNREKKTSTCLCTLQGYNKNNVSHCKKNRKFG